MPSSTPEPSVWLDRALAAWAPIHGLVRRRVWRRSVLLDGPWPGAGTTAVWGLSQVLTAAGQLARLGVVTPDELARWWALAEPYRDRGGYAPFPGSWPRYFDDNAWMGLALVQAHLASGQPDLLDRAAWVLERLRPGERHGSGGIHWIEHPAESCHTCSTAPTGELAARLHLLRGAPADLALAERTWGYLDRSLRTPSGLYADNRRNDGTVDPAIYSYNQGTPVGLAVLLDRISGHATHRGAARQTADAALAHFGTDDRLWTHAPAFNAILLRNLALLDATDEPREPSEGATSTGGAGPNGRRGPVAPADATGHDQLASTAWTSDFHRLLLDHAERLWVDGRHPSTGWFTEGGIGRYERGGVLDQAGVVQVFVTANLVTLAAPARRDLC